MWTWQFQLVSIPQAVGAVATFYVDSEYGYFIIFGFQYRKR